MLKNVNSDPRNLSQASHNATAAVNTERPDRFTTDLEEGVMPSPKTRLGFGWYNGIRARFSGSTTC